MDNQEQNTNVTNTATQPTTATQPATNPPADRPKKFSNKVIIIAAIVVGLAVIGAVVAIILLSRTPEKAETPEEQEVTETVKEEEEEELPNTPLKSGSVTTTIDGKSVTYNAAYVVDGIEATIGSGTYEATEDDQVAILVINGGSLKIKGDGVTITKSGSDGFQGRGDNYSFYGTNSAIVVVGENSKLELDGPTIQTTTSGANAIVATNGGEATVKNADISTTEDNSRGLHATYQGKITADTVKINTLGGSCAALATDRGEGTVTAKNMALSTAGAGSPLIYSTGKITVTKSKGTATGAQIAVVEGKNSITLKNDDFKTNGIGNRNKVDNAAVMIYQSMSGDAGEGAGTFTAEKCTLTVLEDSPVYAEVPFFFVTNTTANINLTDVTAKFNSSQKFVSAKGTSEWGRSGVNGGKVNLSVSGLKATNENVETDGISIIHKV